MLDEKHQRQGDDDNPEHVPPARYALGKMKRLCLLIFQLKSDDICRALAQTRIKYNYRTRSRIIFICSISCFCAFMISSHSLISSGSVRSDPWHIRIAPEWCGIIERKNCVLPTGY